MHRCNTVERNKACVSSLFLIVFKRTPNEVSQYSFPDKMKMNICSSKVDEPAVPTTMAKNTNSKSLH